MNLVQTAEQLKDISDQQLLSELQSPSGAVPGYLVVSEMNRRKELRDSSKAQQQQPPQRSVAEELASRMQPGQQAPMMLPQQMMPPQMPQAPMMQGQGYRNGGIVHYQNGGEVDPLELLMMEQAPPLPSMASLMQEYRQAVPRTDHLAGVESGLEAIQKELGKRKSRTGKEALLQAGLAMMASRSPYFMESAGLGGIAGLRSYQQNRESNDAAQRALLNTQAQVGIMRQADDGRQVDDAYKLGMMQVGRDQADRLRQMQGAQRAIQMAAAGVKMEPTAATTEFPTVPGMPAQQITAPVPPQAGYNVIAEKGAKRLVAPSAELRTALQAVAKNAGRVDDKTLEEQFTEIYKNQAAAKMGVQFEALPSEQKVKILSDARAKWADSARDPMLEVIRTLTAQNLKNNGGMSNEQFKRMTSLSNGFRAEPTVKTYNDVRAAYTGIADAAKDAAADPSGVSDVTLMRLFAKITDPTTGVREEEYRTFSGAQGALNQLKLFLSGKWIEGQKLTPQARQAFVSMAKKINDTRERAYRSTVSQYKRQAKEAGLDDDLVVGDKEYPSLVDTSTAVTPGSRPPLSAFER